MARNQEKAQSMLNRFLTAKKEGTLGLARKRDRDSERRPLHVEDATEVKEAERWRWQVVKEMTRKIFEVQNRMHETKCIISWSKLRWESIN